MKTRVRNLVSLLLFVFLVSSSVIPCGPGWTTPIFESDKAPEYPYKDFAAGRLGILHPSFQRSVLLAAYRYINGGSFNADEQAALVDRWKADIDRDYEDNSDESDAIQAWVTKRKEVVSKDEKTPDIYVERSYGGYEFFPNCTKNAFEVATDTLSDRITSHGPSDPNVADWVKAQDAVFANCASGKQTPDDPAPGAPDWLQKDRDYQKAAALFYSLNYADAKSRFAQIAQDTESPWRETADYLVARTLIRQASMAKTADRATALYEEAEMQLRHLGGGKYAASAERLQGLVAFRIHPKERVRELAQKLAFSSGDDDFRQDLVDYDWLLDKFSDEILVAEQKRIEAEEAKKNGNSNASNANATTVDGSKTSEQPHNPDDLELNLYSKDYSKSWTIYVKPDATDDEAIAAAAVIVGSPLTDEMKTAVREQRQMAYSQRFEKGQISSEEQYSGDGKLTRTLLPDYLQQDELTNWLFTFQMTDADAYAYSLAQFRSGGSDLWLMTAITKADKSSPGIGQLLEASQKVNRDAPAYLTIIYNAARLYLAMGKQPEAKQIIDDTLAMGDNLPLGSRNQFIDLKRQLAETMDDFLRDSLRHAYAFDFSGDPGTIDDIIAKEKTYYDPTENKDGREAYDKEVEDRYKDERLWEDREMLDPSTIDVLNTKFPQTLLIEAAHSPAMPDYLRPQLVRACWVRAYLLDDMATLLRLTPELAQNEPDLAPGLNTILAAKTQAAQDHAILYFVLKDPILSPMLEEGMGRTDNEFGQMDDDDWWCSQSGDDQDASDDTGRKKIAPPKFLTAAQQQTAAAERAKINARGDAPQMFATLVFNWARQNPTDHRIPEALYIVHEANGWTKYGCGNNEDTAKQAEDMLKKQYPQSEWTAKLIDEEKDQ